MFRIKVIVLSIIIFSTLKLFNQEKKYKDLIPDPDFFFEEINISGNFERMNNINVIGQSTDGFIWIGNREGLLLYNGYSIELFDTSLTKCNVNCFFQEDSLHWWVGTNHGVKVILNNKVITKTELHSLSNKTINCIFRTRDNKIWIGTNSGIYIYDKGQLSFFNEISIYNITAIAQDKNGLIYIGTINGLLYIIDNMRVIKKYSRDSGIIFMSISDIVIDIHNKVWIGTKKGLFFYDGVKFKIFDQNNGLTNPVINDLTFDKRGLLWIATEGGVFLFENNKIKKFSTNEGLSNDLAYCVFEDREGNIFVGTHGNALNKLKRSRLKLFNTKNGLSSSWYWSVFEDKSGNLWLGTNGNGLDRITNKKIYNYSVKEGLPGNIIRTIGQDKFGNILVGTNLYGISVLKGNTFHNYIEKDRLPSSVIRVIYTDKKGNLWIGTNSGLAKYDYTNITKYTTENGLVHNVIRCITEDKNGKILIGTSKGLSIFYEGKFTNYSFKNGLSDSLIFDIAVDNTNTYWIAAYNNGIMRIKDGKISKFTSKDGILNSTSYQIYVTSNNYIVVSCNIGLYMIKISDLNDYADGKIKGPLRSILFQKEYGSPILECNGGNQPSGYQLKNGEIWASTLSGVAMINPNNTRINEYLPKTTIYKVTIDKKEYCFEDVIEVPPGSDLVKIEFSSLSFSNPKENRYKYLVEGYNSDWVDIGTQNVAYLSNLRHGEYKFKVISCNNDGLWNFEPATVIVNIKPYFYQTKTFFVVMTLLVISIIYIGYSLKVNILKKRETELLNIVTERTKSLIESQNMVKHLIESKEKFFSIITHDMKNLFTVLLFIQKICILMFIQ